MASSGRRPAFAAAPARPSAGSLTAVTPASAEPPVGRWRHPRRQRSSAPCTTQLDTSSGGGAPLAAVAAPLDKPCCCWKNSSSSADCSRKCRGLQAPGAWWCVPPGTVCELREVVGGVWIRARIEERWWELTWALGGFYFSAGYYNHYHTTSM